MEDFQQQRAATKARIRRRGIYLLPNLFTTAALFAGFYAIVQGMNQRFEDAQRWLHYIFDPTDTSSFESPRRST